MLKKMTSFPTHLAKIKQNSDLYTKHPSLGHILFLGIDSQALRFITAMIMQISRLNYYILKSEEDLLQILYRIDPLVIPKE